MAIQNLSRSKTALVALAIGILSSVSGCTALGPPQAEVKVYGEHVSHITQHEPFAADPTNYGYNTVNLALTIETQRESGPFLTLADGYNLTSGGDYTLSDVGPCADYSGPGQCMQYGDPYRVREYGALAGPREVFSARLGWRWVLN